MRNSWERHRNDRSTRLHVIVVEGDGRLLFVMPLVIKRDWSGLRILRWLDSKTPLYNDVLVDPAADFPTLAAMVGEHLASIPFVRALKVGFVRQDSALARLLQGMGARSEPQTKSYELDLRKYSGWEDFIGSKSSSSRQSYRRMHRRLADRGRVEIERIGDPARLESEIAWIFATKRAWVRRRFGKDNWLSPPATEAWFRSAAVRLSGDGRAFVLRMSCNGSRVAATLVFRHGEALFASKIAYDPGWAKCSPGWLLNLELVRWGFGEGIHVVDFMLGEDPWKEGFSNVVCDVRKYRLALRLGFFRLPGLSDGRRGWR